MKSDIAFTWLKVSGAHLHSDMQVNRTRKEKIKIGILRINYLPQTETYYVLPMFEHIDQSIFEVTLIGMQLGNHPLEQYCRSHADHYLQIQGSLDNCAEQIRNLHLDILIIGTNVSAVTHPISLLAQYRLSPIQITSAVNPVGSGIKNIDYLIWGFGEPPHGGQAHCRETFIRMAGLGGNYHFAEEEDAPTVAINRKTEHIAEDATVFISGVNFFKITREVMDAWVQIIANTPDSRLVLFPYNPNWANNYLKIPFMRALTSACSDKGVDAKRIIIHDVLPNRADVIELLKIGDVYLDAFTLAGVTSMREPLEIGLPLVVCRGHNLGSSLAAPYLTNIGLDELVADDVTDYIRIASQLGKDSNKRLALRQNILDRMQDNPAFFNLEAANRAWNNMFLDIFNGKYPMRPIS